MSGICLRRVSGVGGGGGPRYQLAMKAQGFALQVDRLDDADDDGDLDLWDFSVFQAAFGN